MLGLSDTQVAEAVAGFPSLLGYTVDDNLKPTVRWFRELGLSDMQGLAFPSFRATASRIT